MLKVTFILGLMLVAASADHSLQEHLKAAVKEWVQLDLVPKLQATLSRLSHEALRDALQGLLPPKAPEPPLILPPREPHIQELLPEILPKFIPELQPPLSVLPIGDETIPLEPAPTPEAVAVQERGIDILPKPLKSILRDMVAAFR